MSLFGAGGGRRAEPRERTAEERRKALIDRERRRTGDPNWQPPADHPLARDASAEAAAAPRQANPQSRAPQQPPAQARQSQVDPRRAAPEQRAERQGYRQPAEQPADSTGWWDDGVLHEEPAQPQSGAWQAPAGREPEPVLRPRQPAHPPEPVVIEPDPPALPPAEAFELPDIREVAVHRRRGARTVVSPPGGANMGGTLPGPSRKRRLIAVGLLGAVLLLGWSQWQLWEPLKGGGEGAVTVEIPQGSTASEVASKLQEAGVVDSATLFGLRALISGKRQNLTAGTLKLKKNMSYSAALAALSGTQPNRELETQSITVQEGLSIREVGQRFKRQGVLKDYNATAKKLFKTNRSELRTKWKLPASVTTLEGFLFPATFELPVPLQAEDLVTRQLQSFEQNFGPISMTKAKRAGLTPYEVLIIASMVEREARLTRERPIIAAVIYNRLKLNMPLGIDATFRYASGDWTNPIRQSELDKDGPYNSRKRIGLPPTPIGNPGLASIEAAANPANVNYLYFVVKPNRCGEHAFSATNEKFLADQQKYNQARNEAGKSPVTC